MIKVSKILPVPSAKNRKQATTEQENQQTAKEIDPEQSEFFQTLKPMLTPEALAVVLRKEK